MFSSVRALDMPPPTFGRVLGEMATIGVITTAVGMAISTPPMYIGKPKEKHPSAKTLAAVALSLFLTGATVHATMEVTGLNKMYCRRYMS